MKNTLQFQITAWIGSETGKIWWHICQMCCVPAYCTNTQRFLLSAAPAQSTEYNHFHAELIYYIASQEFREAIMRMILDGWRRKIFCRDKGQIWFFSHTQKELIYYIASQEFPKSYPHFLPYL